MHRHIMILASASALGIAATATELQRGRLMRAPEHVPFPSWRYGPGGASVIVNSEDETPKGYEDHPSKVKGAEPAPEGTHTARQSANGSISEASAAKTTTAKSQTVTDPAKAAKSGVGGMGSTPAPSDTAEIDAYGHPFDPALHAATRSKTKAGLWRLKGVGAKRADPAPGYPKVDKPLDL